MQLFSCQVCGQVLEFENTHCERCGRVLGFAPDAGALLALEPSEELRWHATGNDAVDWRFCSNSAYQACNWLIPADSRESRCRACRLNRVIPDPTNAINLMRWQRLEAAKHRLVYGLLRLGLPLENKVDSSAGIAFEFLSDQGTEGSVVMGHLNGVITLRVEEADDVVREVERQRFSEPYRTVLGHLRHEIGHFYWQRLVAGTPWIEAFRASFGDERSIYLESLQRHHSIGPDTAWSEDFITAYASAHPWEDWAETCAHYLHLLDGLETADAYGLKSLPTGDRRALIALPDELDPYETADFDALVSAWIPLVSIANGLARSVGQADMYPFVLRPAVIEKMRFVHEVLRHAPTAAPASTPPFSAAR